jgi:hypothetical protein
MARLCYQVITISPLILSIVIIDLPLAMLDFTLVCLVVLFILIMGPPYYYQDLDLNEPCFQQVKLSCIFLQVLKPCSFGAYHYQPGQT